MGLASKSPCDAKAYSHDMHDVHGAGQILFGSGMMSNLGGAPTSLANGNLKGARTNHIVIDLNYAIFYVLFIAGFVPALSSIDIETIPWIN